MTRPHAIVVHPSDAAALPPEVHGVRVYPDPLADPSGAPRCPETGDKHQWTLIDGTDEHEGRFKAWACPCRAWRRVTLKPEHETP